MIFGIGTDIVEISRMSENLNKHGERFAKRILSNDEFLSFENKSNDVMKSAFLAKRFAAKEAAVKALGTGFRDGISMTHIVVVNDALGKPMLKFTGTALEILNAKNITSMHLSLSDEKEYAVAYVVFECDR